jgi:hypothetical protein
MGRLVRFELSDGGSVDVEVDEPVIGRASRASDALVAATRTFEDALGGVRRAAEVALREFRDAALGPDQIELEFGVKLTAEAGAVIAKTGGEGQLTVRLTWGRPVPDGFRREPDAI